MKIQTNIELLEGDRRLILLEAIEVFDDGSGGHGVLSLISGHFACDGYPFYFDDLKPFCRDLIKLHSKLKGKARLEQRYEHDFIEFEIDRLGHIKVHGEIGDSGEERQKMNFSFTVDQSYLPTLITSVKSALKEMDEVE